MERARNENAFVAFGSAATRNAAPRLADEFFARIVANPAFSTDVREFYRTTLNEKCRRFQTSDVATEYRTLRRDDARRSQETVDILENWGVDGPDLDAATAFLTELSDETCAAVPFASFASLEISGDFRDRTTFFDVRRLVPAGTSVERTARVAGVLMFRSALSFYWLVVLPNVFWDGFSERIRCFFSFFLTRRVGESSNRVFFVLFFQLNDAALSERLPI